MKNDLIIIVVGLVSIVVTFFFASQCAKKMASRRLRALPSNVRDWKPARQQFCKRFYEKAGRRRLWLSFIFTGLIFLTFIQESDSFGWWITSTFALALSVIGQAVSVYDEKVKSFLEFLDWVEDGKLSQKIIPPQEIIIMDTKTGKTDKFPP